MNVGLKNNKITGEFPVQLASFKKLQIDVQGKQIRNLAEELCNMKKWNGGLVGNFGCDSILFNWYTFSS